MEQARSVKLLVKDITVFQDHINISIRTLGLQSLAVELDGKEC